jgi:hypothetical protein
VVKCVNFAIERSLDFELFFTEVSDACIFLIVTSWGWRPEFDKDLKHERKVTLSLSSLWIRCSLMADFRGEGERSSLNFCRGVLAREKDMK